MIADVIAAAAPTADALLALTENELQRVVLHAMRSGGTERMATCDGLVTSLFGPNRYDVAKRVPVEKAIKAAWQDLESAKLIEEPDSMNGRNGYRVVSDRGLAVNTDVDLAAARVRSWLTPDLVDAALHGACLNAFKSADYDTAVFEAFKAVEAAVRKKSGYGSSDFGAAMMEKAFDPKTGPLRDPSAPLPRQKARQRLFMGAIGELRNPKAHGDPTISDPREAIEEIMTASVLLRIVGA